MNNLQPAANGSACSERHSGLRKSRSFLLLPVICAALWSPGLWASEAYNVYDQLYTKGTGSVFLDYQYIDVRKFQNGVNEVPIGEVQTQSLYLQVDYVVSERLRLELGIPYIKKRASGAPTHNPATLDPPHPEVSFIDDGKYRGKFQDFYFGANYLWINNPVRLEPFFHVFIPSHDYQFFANSAVGQDLWRVEFGLELTHFLPFSDWYYRAGVGYNIMEQTVGVNVNHFRFNAELGYFFTPNFSLNVFGIARKGNGNSAQAFPPWKRTDEAWFQHDRTTRHGSANVGVGADWFFHDNLELSANAFTTVWGDSVHWVDFAGSIGITRYF